MIFPKIAFRNLFRQRRRSLLTLLTMAVGFALCSVSLGIVDGTYSALIDLFTRDRTGHVQVHKKGYLDRPSLYNAIGRWRAMGDTIGALPGVTAWAPRVYSPALAALGNKTTGARIVGVLPAQEAETTRLKQEVRAGRFLSDHPANEVMLGAGLAEILKAKPGDEMILITQAADGSIANDLFRVVGVVGKRDDAYERTACYMHLKTAQAFLALGDRVHELAVVLSDQSASREAARRIRVALADTSLDVEPWQVVEKSFYRAMQADRQGNWITLGIIMVIVGIGVLNTVLMTILERTREFGVLRALGTRPADVFKLVVLETAFLAVLGIVLGSGVSLAANVVLSHHGISYPTPLEYGGMVFDRMVSRVTFQTIWIPAAVTFGTAVVVSLLPALRAARIEPVRAMRMF